MGAADRERRIHRLQIAVGITQWLLELPASLVWVHVAIATFLWVAVLWSVATAGMLEQHPEGDVTSPLLGS